jgi:signal transduction histidine kinase
MLPGDDSALREPMNFIAADPAYDAGSRPDERDSGYSRPFHRLPRNPFVKSALPLKLVIPLVLGIVASLAIAVYAELGYRRLESANRQMAVALAMQAAVHQTLALITDAETGQRGFLLTGKEEYLGPYKVSIPKIEGEFSKLRELLVESGTPSDRDRADRLNNLIGQKLLELEAVIALYQKDGAESALALMNTGIGRRTMDTIRTEVEGIAATQRMQLTDANSRWTRDIEFARVGMMVVTALTVALLLVVWVLVRRDTHQREATRRAAHLENQRLETLIEERTASLSELSNHLQEVREEERSKLARDIHDELGGILVSAKMDMAWVDSRIKGRDPETAAKVERAMQALDEGVQIKRRIIEELRPTLLDNLGLSAALDWQIHEICDRAGIKCVISTPADDSSIPPSASIALFRIVQEALTNIVKYARAKNVSVDLGMTDDAITLLVEDDGIGIPDDAQNNLLSHGISGMRQRVRSLHGEFSIVRRAEGGTMIEVGIPFQRESPPSTEAT